MLLMIIRRGPEGRDANDHRVHVKRHEGAISANKNPSRNNNTDDDERGCDVTAGSLLRASRQTVTNRPPTLNGHCVSWATCIPADRAWSQERSLFVLNSHSHCGSCRLVGVGNDHGTLSCKRFKHSRPGIRVCVFHFIPSV